MRNSIRWRLIMMYVLLVVIVMMVSGTMIVLMIRSTEVDALEAEMKITASNVLELFDETNPGTIEDVDEILSLANEKKAFKNTTSIRTFILNKKAMAIYPLTTESGVVVEQHSPQVHKVLTQGSDDSLGNRFDQNRSIAGVESKYIGYAEGIELEGKVVYVIYVMGNISLIDQSINDIIQIILISIAVALVIAAVLGFVFSEFLTKPISALSMKARDMQRGRMDQPMKVYSNDEIGQLTKNFNKMAISLNDTLNEITSEKNKLEIVFKHMTDGILVFDKIGMMIHSNPASISMLKIDKQISFQEVFRPYLDVSYREMKEMVEGETISHMVEVGGKYYSVYFAKFLDQKNVAVGLICVIQDITEHKKLEEMQKEFVANVSHELRTPLTTIKSYAETLLEGALDDKPTAERFLGVINHEGDRMTALVADLLELSKLDNRQVKFKMMDINLEHILAESVEKFKIQAERKRQSIVYHPPLETARIVGDANRVEQVIKNIVSNAIKYSQEEALVEISLRDTDKYHVIRVSDNGMGISREDLKRIFDRFFRVDKARSREMGGTGLGLAIAKEIMEFHGGKIEVTSEISEGTTFELYFVKKLGNSY